MKNMSKLLIALVAVMFLATGALAKTNGNAGEPLSLDNDDLVIAVSPGVSAAYFDDDGATPAQIQWYVIGTYHEGGSMLYGTTQSLTKIYKKEFDPAVETKDFSDLPDNYDDAASEQQWIDGGFND